MPICVPKVPIWSLTPNFIIWAWNQPKNGACLSILSIFFQFFPFCGGFWGLLCSFNPLLSPKLPPRSPYWLIPLILCIASPTNQKTDLVCKFGSFFFIFSLSNFFGHFFWPFLTPHYAYMCAQGPHMDLNPEFYNLTVESAKKRSLFIDSFNFFQFFPFWGGFCSFGVKKGHFKRVEQCGEAPQWPPEVLHVFIYTNHNHKILGSSK